MKLRCLCGHVIVDQTDNLSYKAHLLTDRDYGENFDKFIAYVVDFFLAYAKGEMDIFLNKYYPSPENRALFISTYLGEDSNLSSIMNDAFFLFIHDRLMYECEQCGRIWIQTNLDENHMHLYSSYRPESDFRHVLRTEERH